ncbi:MAG: hypothetical protein OES46_18155, partial [Gammaproteobacteria bacterium]|nr:hypothetical protein [Gammaproteobacteria bacterium]
FLTTPAAAQGCRLGKWGGSVELLADRSEVETETGSRETTNDNTRTEERVTIRNRGAYVFDPRLLTLNLGVTFARSQEDTESQTNGTLFKDDSDDDLSGFDFYAGVLSGSDTFSANVFANRSEFTLNREFAGRTDIDVENRGATFSARRLPIPSTLTIRQELNDEESRTGPIVTATDERRDIVTYDGQRGWNNAVMVLKYESVDKSDDVRPDFDFESDEARVDTSLDFGPALNRRWDSRIRAFSREDFSEEDRLDFDQRVLINHSERLRTQYRYELDDTERPGGDVTTQTASFNLNHQLYESLTTNLLITASNDSFDDGDRDIHLASVNLGYSKRLPRQGHLNAGLGLSTQEEEDDFDEAFVAQEPHTFATPFALPEALDNPNVIESSVDVTKTVNGPAVPGCGVFPVPIPLVEGVDYTLSTVGSTTEIVPLPCSLTTPGINPGDTIAVDYRFTRGGAPVTFTTDQTRADFSVDYGWIRPFFSYQRMDQDLVSGSDDSFLTDQESDTIGVALRYDRTRLRANFLVAVEDFESDDQTYEEVRATQFLRYAFKPGLSLTVNGQQSFRDFSFPEDRETDIVAARAALSYRPRTNLSAEFFASVRDIEDTLVQDERRTELGVLAHWSYGKLEVHPSLTIIDIERDTSDSRDYRAFVRVIRRFF